MKRKPLILCSILLSLCRFSHWLWQRVYVWHLSLIILCGNLALTNSIDTSVSCFYRKESQPQFCKEVSSPKTRYPSRDCWCHSLSCQWCFSTYDSQYPGCGWWELDGRISSLDRNESSKQIVIENQLKMTRSSSYTTEACDLKSTVLDGLLYIKGGTHTVCFCWFISHSRTVLLLRDLFWPKKKSNWLKQNN